MLLGQDGGGSQQRHLLAVHDSLHGGAEGHFGFAVAHVAAHQAIHVAGRFHVPANVVHGLFLVWGQFVREGVLKFPLPGGVRAEGVARGGLALGVEPHQVEGQLL